MIDRSFDDESRQLAALLISGAVGFVETASASLQIHGDEKRPRELFHWPAFYVNLCYAYELYLKAWLAAHGWSESNLKSKIHHDLEKAFSEAKTLGFKPHSDSVFATIKLLCPIHKSSVLRYLRATSVELPQDHNEALRLAVEHIKSIGTQLQVSTWGAPFRQ